MKAFTSRAIVFGVLLAASLGATACRRTYVVVPRPSGGYSPMDTLRGRSDGRDVRVTFHFDTTWRVDTVVRPDTIWREGSRLIVRVDTLRVSRTDTVYFPNPRRDTVVRTDTVRVAGRRTLFVPPGHYPPAGQCRVWIYDRAPGQQARAAPCNALGEIPSGAFILFGGDAWDADFDWIAEAQRGEVPPEIVALTRRRGGRP